MKCALCEVTAETEVEIGLHLAEDHGMLASEARKKAAEIAGTAAPRTKGAAAMARGKKGTATAGRCSYCKRRMDGPHAPACRPAATNGWPRAAQPPKPTGDRVLVADTPSGRIVATETGIQAWLETKIQAARVRLQVLEAMQRELP